MRSLGYTPICHGIRKFGLKFSEGIMSLKDEYSYKLDFKRVVIKIIGDKKVIKDTVTPICVISFPFSLDKFFSYTVIKVTRLQKQLEHSNISFTDVLLVGV